MDERSSFDETFNYIHKNMLAKHSGQFNSIPFGLPSLDKHVPGVMRGTQYIVTASSGVGKTQVTKYLFVNQVYKFVKAHPELGIKLKFNYFALEESKREFMLTLICNRLKEEYGIDTNPMELTSMGEYCLSEEVLKKVDECREYFAELEKCLEIIDYISNPFGIFKHIRQYARDNGKFYYKGAEVNPEAGGLYDQYIANDPNEYVIDIVDHVGLLQPEATADTNTLHGAVSKFSAEYGRKNITKHYNHVLVIVQQQAADQEKAQFTTRGESIEQKLEPTLNGLADNKLTQRDALVVLSLFAPVRHNIETHMGYDIRMLQDNYRCLAILKNRFGRPNLKCGLYFDGATNTFKELPGPLSMDMKILYEEIRNSRE